MKQPSLDEQYQAFESIALSAFGTELLRHSLLPELFGKDNAGLLYWAGKQLARRYPLATLEDIAAFFERAGWGTISIGEERKDELHIELSGPIISARLSLYDDCTFQLEAGFLAQQIEQQKRFVTEAVEMPSKQAGKARILVKWDRKQSID
ncbi:putative hydrocarbon binding protein [Geobacillus thermodenitrificans]|uniref:YslB family protein n=1 Tax=Geobacillus thermodenitrificans TaxID=33940 RepID=UPI002DF74E51|nr:putative hydrocarbon binding protein [Geobacillus thermodenitrificans]